MRRTTKSFTPVLLHGKFKQTKVKTKIINGSPAPVYKRALKKSPFFMTKTENAYDL